MGVLSLQHEDAVSVDKLLGYLTRKVSGVVLADPEELMAAQVIVSLQQEVQRLEQLLASSAQAGSLLESASQKVAPLDTVKDGYVSISQAELEALQAARKKDGQRIAFILQEDVYAAGDYVFAHEGFERVEIVEGDYRTAVDRLMGS